MSNKDVDFPAAHQAFPISLESLKTGYNWVYTERKLLLWLEKAGL